MNQSNQKEKVLFVGEHPLGFTGNSGMLRGLMSQIDPEKYDISCVGIRTGPVDDFKMLFRTISYIHNISDDDRYWGAREILAFLQRFDDLKYIVFVGLDIWRYKDCLSDISKLARQKGFRFIYIFPYDLQDLRPDWVEWINNVDVPCVYSQYGYDMLKDHVPNLQYFRPPFQIPEIWEPLSEDKKEEARKSLFPFLKENDFVFGFVGPNQVRKDIPALLRAFSMIYQNNKSVRLYMHTRIEEGTYNIIQMSEDYGIGTGGLLLKKRGIFHLLNDMVRLYNSFDCLLNCTMQEGLSWTVIEAMLCGIPVIASHSTAHIELLKDIGILVPCELPNFVPMIAKRGPSFIDSKSCDPKDMSIAMTEIMEDKELRKELGQKSREFALEWLKGCSNINDLLGNLGEISELPETQKLPAILFVQESSGGDVLMTTRCFKGIRKRHPNFELHYMTSDRFAGIVKGNPYLDKIIPWDENEIPKYQFVYNPHKDKILPGHWGRNANSILADFYWKILLLDQPDDFYVAMEKDEYLESFVENNKFCAVHTTGGDPRFRTYMYMSDVCKGLSKRGFKTVQLGGQNDYLAEADYDLRGLSYEKTGFVMSHAELCISVDSYISHLAGALGISQVVLFGSGNASVCRPRQTEGRIIAMSPDYVMDCKGLGPCSGSIRDCPVPCTGRHTPGSILENVDILLEGL